MKMKLTLAALIIAPIMLTACGKKEEAKNVEQQEQVASEVSAPTTPEQQAAIDAIDKPELQDKKNAEAVNSASEEAASEAQ
ncbi:hypothetical protein [Acinetobacter sp. TR3]|jgi:uncharacterized protein YcfL|uniref:hypothetical protein n=1 Tax=unclassified Acinetobacter TaxID=196816 RepID=UPI0022ABCCC3|nr:hypothetical protein [Acinetobacter sp. TR3]WAU75481.1 hypothetical protein O1449_09175 [Acinetobacter sp. TR3]